MEVLKPYRARIDAIDAQLIALLRARYDVIEEVGQVKAQAGIAAFLDDRVQAVHDRAVRLGMECGLDGEIISRLWTHMIAHCCALEDEIISRKSGPTNKDTRRAG